MKILNLKTLRFFLIGIPIVFLFACSSEHNSAESVSSHDIQEAGPLAIRLRWDVESISSESDVRHASDIVLNPDNTVNCLASGIDKIHATVFDPNGDFLIDNGSGWNCEDHYGIIPAVPAGPGRKVVVVCKDTSGNVLGRGERTDVTVVADVEPETIDPVVITVNTFTSELSSPADGASLTNETLQFEWYIVEAATSYHLQVATDSTFGSVVIDEILAGVSHTPSASLPPGLYYWRVRTIETAGSSGLWSAVRSLNISHTYTVTFEAGPNGKLEGTTTQVVGHGLDCTAVRAIPDPNYRFITWSSDIISSENPLTVTNITNDMTITANFELIPLPEINIQQASTDIVSGGDYTFPSVTEGLSGAPVAFSIENTGTADLILTGSPAYVSIIGTNANDFNITQPTASGISPNSSISFLITFSPTAPGNRTATITIENNDSDEGAYMIILNGTGVERTPFWITGTTPENADSDVRIDTNIEIQFNLNININTIAGTTINSNGTFHSFSASWHAGSNTLILDPDSDLPERSPILVELPSTVTGYNNELFTGDMSFSFTTGTSWHDGNTIFVAPTGVTGNPGTKALPLLSIQEAVNTAYANGYLQVYVQNGTYSYSNDGLEPSDTAGLHITEPIIIIGGWNSTFTTYSGTHSILDGESNCDHVVFIQSSDVDLQYLEITGGNADADTFPHGDGGGILFYNTELQSNINIQNIDIIGNTAIDQGGGVYLESHSRYVTFLDCNISNNSASSRGAGIQASRSCFLTLDNVDITDNSGEGIATLYANDLSITSCFFRDNGGTAAIYMWGGSNVTIYNTYISSENYGIYLNSNSGTADPFPTLSISNCSFSSNTYGSTTVTAIREGQSEVHGHTLQNNRFLSNYLGNLYRDWDGTITPADDTGIGYLNTADHANHDANPASGNQIVR